MANHHPHYHTGAANHHGYQPQQLQPQPQHQQPYSRHDSRARDEPGPLALNEALPYTPFTSVFPFEPNIINHPTIGSGPLAPPLSSLVSSEDYDTLNQESGDPSQCRRPDGSLEYVQYLLRAEKITQFQFKTAPEVIKSPDRHWQSPADGLSPFARMVYEGTSVSFRYPTAETPTSNGQTISPRVTKKSPVARKHEPPKIVKHNPATTNAQAVADNKARIEIHIPSSRDRNAAAVALYTSPKPSSTPSSTQPTPMQPQTVSLADLMVTPQGPSIPVPKKQVSPKIKEQREVKEQPEEARELLSPGAAVQTGTSLAPQPQTPAPAEVPRPSLSTPRKPAIISIELPAAKFNREEFAVVPDSPDLPAHLSIKTKRKDQGEIEDPLGDELNQRERANVAFRDLRKHLQDIFHAEEQLAMQPGASSNLIVLTQEQEPTMTSSAHDKAQKYIRRAIDMGCFGQAPIDDLHRIQSLSEASLRHAESLDIKIDESWGETEVGFLEQQLPDIDAGLKAARTALRIMCGGREEKQVYSEDLIQLSLNLFRNVMEGIIVPMAELRSTGPTGNLFRYLSTHKKTLGHLFTSCQRLFSLMSDLVGSISLSEMVVNTLESLSSSLMFVENAYTEKDSVVGVQKFDGLRLVAMNILSQIFLMKPEQREGILKDILTSLEKLPVGKVSARQFKLADGGSIQPVSALIMRLIQASAGKVDDHHDRNGGRTFHATEEKDRNVGADTSEDAHANSRIQYSIRTEDHAAIQNSTAVQELQSLADPLFTTAFQNASYVVKFIVQRALGSTKSGDTPYRNLLDLFIEDFTTCLDSPDWPAAELILRLTVRLMLAQSNGEKNSAPARNMALELLGVMAAAISRLRSHVRKVASNFEGSGSDELGRWLADLALMILDGHENVEKTLGWLGPYRVVLEFLHERLADDEHLRSAISYLITDWGYQVAPAYESLDNDTTERDSEFGRNAYRLRNMIEDPKWLPREYRFQSVLASHARLSHSVILLRSSFCSQFKTILNVLLGSMTTDQATVRSRSLKSINQVLETDPTILDVDDNVVELILHCSNDSSPQVRDSALGLIGKCISMRPRLEERMTPTVIERFIDSGIGVRKRAMKLAKDVYLGNGSKIVRSTIANGLLHRMQDPDEGVRELARQMIEEVWISPFYKEDDSIAFKQSLTDHVALIVQTVKHGNTAHVLDKVFQTILSPDSRLAEANSRVCSRLVASMFDLVDNPDSDDQSLPSGKDALQVLQIFAKADPKLFNFEQIRLLKPHIASVSSSEDLAISRAVVVIYRRVLPQVSSVHSQFLQEIRGYLMPATAKITRTLLDDVVACIWIICGLLQTSVPLARLVSSSLAGIQKIRGAFAKGSPKQEELDKLTRTFDRYSIIVGMAGKHCNLDSHEQLFKTNFPKWQGNSVSRLMVDVILPFAEPSRPLDVRRPALDAVGLICQSNPRNFDSPNVWKVFEAVFEEREPVLESMILRSFKEFLLTEEKRSEHSAAGKEPVKKDLKVMGSTSFDDVASATTQRFLKDITRISLGSQDDHAFMAVELLASINRQGLVHPKETGVTLITLQTSPLQKISELAYQEHRALHEKYESVLEREYAKAIQSAFQYQRDIVKDPRGATASPFTAKLHLLVEVLKISKSKNRTRFLEKFVGHVDFDLSKLEGDKSMSYHVAFSRFLIENLAFFEYVTIGELQTTVTAMEKMVTGTGSEIAQSIEAEIFQVRMDPAASSEQSVNGGTQLIASSLPNSVDPARLHQLAAGSIILLALWEARTYLRRLYGLSTTRRESKAKAAAKDLAKPPVRVQGVTGDKFWEDMEHIMCGLAGLQEMTERCRSFVELLNVDSEIKIVEEDDELDADGEPNTPVAVEDDEEAAADGRGRKRKATNTPGGRKKRARSNSRPRPRGRPKRQSTDVAEMDMADDGPWV